MTVHRYIDAQDGSEYDPTERTYSVMELVEEHLTRFVFTTKDGESLILRYMPLRMKRIIDSVIAMMYPTYSQMSARLNDLRDGIIDVPWDDIDKEIRDEFLQLASQMKPVGQMYALGVIEEPFVACMEDIYQIYDRMDDEDQQRFDLLVQELTSVKDPKTVDDTVLDIANRYNLQIMDRQMLKELTISQASYFESIIARENAEINRMLKRDEKVVR